MDVKLTAANAGEDGAPLTSVSVLPLCRDGEAFSLPLRPCAKAGELFARVRAPGKRLKRLSGPARRTLRFVVRAPADENTELKAQCSGPPHLARTPADWGAGLRQGARAPAAF